MSPRVASIDLVAPLDAWRSVGFAVDNGAAIDLGGTVVRWTNGNPCGISAIGLTNIADGFAGTHPSHEVHVEPPSGWGIDCVAVDHIIVRARDPRDFLDQFARHVKSTVTESNGEQSVRVGTIRFDVMAATDLETQWEFWGIAFLVRNLEALANMLGPEVLGAPKPARQDGEIVATFRSGAGLCVPTALMARVGK